MLKYDNALKNRCFIISHMKVHELICCQVSPILVSPSEDPIETVRKIKDFKRKIPGNGRPYFARRCLTAEGREHFQTHWPMEILFNYLGQYQVCTNRISHGVY